MKNIYGYMWNKHRGMLAMCISTIFIVSMAIPIIAKANADVPQFDISIIAEPQRADVGKDIVVKGTIAPKDFTAEVKPKEVVLVLDISGSMQDDTNIDCDEERKTTSTNYYEKYEYGKWHPYNFRYYNYVDDYCSKHRKVGPHKERKIDELKKSALEFIDKMQDVPNLKIGIVTFESKSKIKQYSTDNFDDLRVAINGKDRGDGVIVDDIQAGGGTNIGDGLRQAAYLLSNSQNQNSDKSIVFMTDGEPTQFGALNLTDRDYRYYYNNYGNKYSPPYYLDTTQSYNYNNNSITGYIKHTKEYAQKIGEIIKEKNYNVYSIGYDLNDDGNRTLKDIHNSMTDKTDDFFESSIGSLDKIFAEIADKIAYSATDVKLNLDFPAGIEIIGGNNVISLNNIVYKEKSRNGNTVTYHADPITFDFIIRGNNPGDFNLLHNAKITFMWDGKIKELPLKDLNIIITDSKVPKVVMKATDSAKIINYDSSIKQNNNDENYKLYGKSNIQIEVTDVDATHLRYKFIKDNEESDEWKAIELNSENDIDKTKENHLTHMPYDVSDMPLRADEQMWNNRNEVFKNPFLDKITQISTQVSSGADYVKEENIQKDGQTITRWVPKTLFLENYDVSSYASKYKEASKTWGYMTVPKDGAYTFKAITDDGFYGNIAVDGESKVIGDAFRVKWFKDQPSASEPIKLKAGKYYPVYFEYFNWGGSACYKIECSTTGDKEYAYKEIGAFGIKFYPSKSDLPKDNSNNGFMGSKTIDMPTEFGKYTFQYELVKDLNYGTNSPAKYEKKGEGKFGTFEVEKRFNLERYFSKDENKQSNELEIEKNESFNIEYKVEPKEILVSELYKGKNSYTAPNLLYVKNISIEDSLPQGLFTELVTKDEKKEYISNINLINSSLEYELKGDRYVAKPFTVKANVKCNPNVDKIINFDKSGEINYRDISLNDNLRISQTQCFDDKLTLKIKGESEIIKHGIVDGNKIKSLEEMKNENGYDIALSKNIDYTLGFIVNAQGKDNNFTIKTSDAEITNVFIYELDLNDEIVITTKKQVDNIQKIVQEGNGSGNNIIQGKKYAIVYSARLNNNKTQAEFIAKLDTGSEKHLILNLNQELPDLF